MLEAWPVSECKGLNEYGSRFGKLPGSLAHQPNKSVVLAMQVPLNMILEEDSSLQTCSSPAQSSFCLYFAAYNGPCNRRNPVTVTYVRV